VALQIFAHEIAHYRVVVDEKNVLGHAMNFKTRNMTFATGIPFRAFHRIARGVGRRPAHARLSSRAAKGSARAAHQKLPYPQALSRKNP
jgi:hypothetical protein